MHLKFKTLSGAHGGILWENAKPYLIIQIYYLIAHKTHIC